MITNHSVTIGLFQKLMVNLFRRFVNTKFFGPFFHWEFKKYLYILFFATGIEELGIPHNIGLFGRKLPLEFQKKLHMTGKSQIVKHFS